MTEFKVGIGIGVVSFKPCGCGWEDEKTYIECPDHTAMRKELEQLKDKYTKLEKDKSRFQGRVGGLQRSNTKYRAEIEQLKKIMHEKMYDKDEVVAICEKRDEYKAELLELQGIYCHTLAYQEDTIFDKMSALQIAEHFGYKCFEQSKEASDE